MSADGYNWAASYRNRDAGYKRDRWRSFVEIYDEFMVWAKTDRTDSGATASPANNSHARLMVVLP